MPKARLLGLFLLLSSASLARADDAVSVMQGTWHMHAVDKDGFSSTASGTLKLRLFPAGGRFTCIMYGSGSLSGASTRDGMTATVESSEVALSAASCSGTYDAANGTLMGDIGITANGTVHLRLEVEGKPAERKSLRQDKTRNGHVDGQVTGAQATGTFTDADGDRWTWSVAGEAPVAPAPPPAANPPPSGSDTLRDKALALKAAWGKATTPEQRQAAQDDYQSQSKRVTEKEVAALDRELESAGRDDEWNKELDEAANALANDAHDAALEKAKEVAVEKADGIFAKAWHALTGKDASGAVTKAVAVKDKVDEAVETLEEIQKVAEKVNDINEQVKRGELSEGRGKVLKGATFLGKALAKTVSWLPVPGLNKAGSEVTDKTFEAALKVGEKLGKHATTTDCCARDPQADCCG